MSYDSVKAAFEKQVVLLPLDIIVPQKEVTLGHRSGEFYKQLTASLKHVGVIEPLVVYPRGPGDYLLLDGHVRLEILKSIGVKEVKCLLATDDEAYTYIRLSLARNGILRSWKTEVEITSRNLVLEHSNAKDYDAVVEVSIAGESRIFAIEYERTAKASARYKEIRELLSSDRTVETVLYLTSNHDVLYLLAVELRGVAKQIGIALSDQFRRDLLKTQTLRVGAVDDVIEFRDLIAQ